MPREATIVEAIRRLLTRRGAWHIKTHGAAAGRNGIPDIVAIYRGRGLAIEVKTPGGKPNSLQRHELARIDAAGGHTIVATGAEGVEILLDNIDRAHAPREERTA